MFTLPTAFLSLIFVALSQQTLCLCLCTSTVLPCAVLSSHHVHQQWPEGEGLCHCLSYVSPPFVIHWFNACVFLLRALTLHSRVALRYDGGGDGHSAGHRDPGPDCGRLLRLFLQAWWLGELELLCNQHVQCLTGGDGEGFQLSAWYLSHLHECQSNLMLSFVSSETSLLACFGGHLHHLRPLCYSLVFWSEGAKRYEALSFKNMGVKSVQDTNKTNTSRLSDYSGSYCALDPLTISWFIFVLFHVAFQRADTRSQSHWPSVRACGWSWVTHHTSN